MEALEVFPRSDVKLKTDKGMAQCQKIDIFKGLMWFSYEKEGMNWHTLKVEKVNEIIAINKKGNTVASLEEFIEDIVVPDEKLFNNVVGQDSLTRFDKPKQSKTNRRKRNNRNKKQGGNRKKGNAASKGNAQKGGKPQNKKRRHKPKPKNNA